MRMHHTKLALIAGLVILGATMAAPASAVLPVSFGPPVIYAIPGVQEGVAVGDLNGDGWPDVMAVAQVGSPGIMAILNSGGTLHPGSFIPFPAGTGGGATCALGDLNGDGKLDVVATNFQNNTASVALGNGDGTFGPMTDLATPYGPWGLLLADLDGDGKLDLVVGGHFASVVRVYLGHGDGTFGSATDFTAGNGTSFMVAGDFNGDGKPDLAVANRWADNVSILLGNGDGTFGTPAVMAAGTWPWGIAAGDFNGDGKLDFAVANHYPAGSVSVYRGHGDGSFDPQVQYFPGGNTNQIASGDFNLDGHLDLAVPLSGDNMAILLGDGVGGFGTPGMVPEPTGGFAVVADLNRDGRPDLVTTMPGPVTGVTVLFNTSGTTIAAQPPATCITPTRSCVEVPVTIANRPDATSLRGYSVTLQLSANLALCGLQAVQGPYLSSIGDTHFELVANGGGSYTVDCAIMGTPCGATASSGTLFTLNLGSSASTGTGTVTVTSVVARNCANAPIAGYAGDPASVTIDNVVPGAIVVSAAQRKSGNDGSGIANIDLAWTGTVTVGDSVVIYRAPWGNYPEYDDVGGGLPAVPAYPPGAPWTKAATVVGVTACADEPPVRDFWYYVAFVKDPCDNVGTVSNRTGGTLDYHLGDVSDGVTICHGDNLVTITDVTLLGAYYGTTIAPGDPVACLDVGPTTDYSVDAQPTTDNLIGFEDLMMFALNYHQVSAPQFAAHAAADRNEVWMDAPDLVQAGESFVVTLRMRGAGDLQGLSTRLGWDGRVAEPMTVQAGDLVASQGGVVFSGAPGGVDAAVLGPGRAIAGDGVLATVSFRAKTAGTPNVTLASLDARDVSNRSVQLTNASSALPRTTQFVPAMPNPFKGTTTLAWSLASGGPVELAVFGVDGRRVATLVREIRSPGSYRQVWDGRDAAGQPVRPGLYYARLVTQEGRFTRALVLIH